MIIQIRKSLHLRFRLLVALLIAMLFTRYAFSLDIPTIFLTALVILIAAIGDRDEFLAIALCCLPLHEAIDLYITLTACAVIWVLKGLQSVRIGWSSLLCLVMVLWELMHCFMPGFDLQWLISSLIPIAFIAVVVCSDVSDIDYAFVVRTFSTMTVAICLVLLTNCVVSADYDFALAMENLQRLGFTSEDELLFKGAVHPNSLGIVNVLCITGLLQLRFMRQNRVTDTWLIVLLITFGALTASRTFLICLLIMAFLFLLGQESTLRRKVRLVLLMILVALVALLLLNWLFPSVFDYYVARFFMEDITTGRDTLMVLYHNFLVANPSVMLFGVGLNNLGEKAVGIYSVAANVPHNSIQEIILAWGIPGLIMVGLLLWMIILESKKYGRRKKILNYIPLMVILAKSMAGQFLSSGYTMVAVVFIYLSFCQNFNHQEKQSDYDSLQDEEN